MKYLRNTKSTILGSKLNLRINISDNIILSNFICSYYFISAVNNLVKASTSIFSAWELFSRAVLGVLLLFALPIIYRRAKFQAMGLETLVGLLFLLRFADDFAIAKGYSSLIFNEMLVYLPLGFCILAVTDYQVLLKSLQKWSIATHLVLYLLALLWFSGRIGIGTTYSMSVGYSLLLQELVLIDEVINEKRTQKIWFVVIDTIIILLFGSRGPLLCLVLFTLLQLGFSSISRQMKVISFFILILSVALFAAFQEQIVDLLISVSIKLTGRTTRTLRLLLSGDLFYVAKRDTLFSTYFSRIKERPFFGWGIAGGWIDNSTYPHNIFGTYSILWNSIGSLLSILLIYSVFKAARSKQIDKRRISLILMAFTAQLLISGSYTMSTSFWMYVLLTSKKNDYSSMEVLNE